MRVPARWRAAFRDAAADARLPVALLAAVAHVESRFQPERPLAEGAVGLLQVMPETAAVLRLDVSDPAANVLAGARFLRAMLDRFGSMDVALAAYNAGPAAVERAGGAPSAETLRYVLDVNARWRAGVGCARERDAVPSDENGGRRDRAHPPPTTARPLCERSPSYLPPRDLAPSWAL